MYARFVKRIMKMIEKNSCRKEIYNSFSLACKRLNLETKEEIDEFAVKCGFYVN